MRALIEALKSKYDIIILDTAPSELLADAPLLGKYVDAALYVIRYDYTKLREIREGVESHCIKWNRYAGICVQW